MKRLFLTSIFANVIEKFIEILPSPPDQLTAAFIPTAADPYEDKWFIDKDRNKLKERGFHLKDVDIKGKSKGELIAELEGMDIVFVAGGNTFYLLEKAKESGLYEIVKESVEKGVIYVGSSAGTILAGPTIEPAKDLDDPSQAPGLKSFKGLDIVDFVVLPHFDKDKNGDRYRGIMKEYASEDYRFIALTDFEAIAVQGTVCTKM
jgi:dipeptidase E